MTPTTMLFDLVRPYRARLAVGTAMLLVSTAAMMGMPQLLKRMFDSALITKDPATLTHTALGMIGVSVLMALGLMARSQLIQLSATRVACDLRQKLADHLMTLDVAWFEARNSGEVLSRLISDIATTRDFVQTGIPMFIRGVLVGVGATVALFMTSPKLASLLLVALVPMVLAGVFLGRKIKGYTRYQQDKLSVFSGVLAEQLGGPLLWKAYAQEERAHARVKDLMTLLVKGSRRQLYAMFGMIAINVLVGFLALTGVVWLGGMDVMAGTMTVGDMMAFLLYLAFMADAVANLGQFWPTWQGLMGSLERVTEIMAEKSRLVGGFHVLPPVKGGRELALEGVHYAYPTRPDDVVLHGLDWYVPRGQTVALVGPSGGGKSTIFRLLQRFDDPTAGVVKMDDRDVKDLAFDVLRKQFALVAQDSPLIAGTVRDNVAFGHADATEDDVWAALASAHADAFVRALPQGLDTPVGERGVQVSGGQRQRLALARALLMDAPVLLLDEATSQLDSESEVAIQAALAEVAKGRTVVMIAHRLSTVRFADRIDVVEGGRIVASGKHDELMKTSPLYAALVALQLR